MKLTALAVITLVVLSCSAAYAQSYTFGFENYDGSVLFCNYETFTLYYNGFIAAGLDHLIPCGAPRDAVLIGAKTTVPAAAGLGQTGKAYALADNLYDAYYGFDTQLQWLVISKTKASNPKHPKQGWIGLAAYSGYIIGTNAGLLTTNIPGGDRPSAGLSIGNAKVENAKAKLKK